MLSLTEQGKRGTCAPCVYRREKPKVCHYRDHYLNDIISALGKQSDVPLTIKKSYLGDKEVAPQNEPQNAHQALKLPKEKARNKTVNKFGNCYLAYYREVCHEAKMINQLDDHCGVPLHSLILQFLDIT